MPSQKGFRSLEPCAAVTIRLEVPRSIHSFVPSFRLITRPLQERYSAIEARSSFNLDSISSIDIDDRNITVSSANCTTLL